MRIDKDIFGNQYVGSRKVIPISLDEGELPMAARNLLHILEEAQVEIDLSALFSEALDQVDPEFWRDRLREFTPLEWKVLHAMEHPTFRSEVEALLNAFEKTLQK